jgi:hypothetical protein
MGKYNRVKEIIGSPEGMLVSGGITVGGAVGAYRDDSSFLRGSAAGALGTFGSAVALVAAINPDKDYPLTVKSRVGFSAVGLGIAGLGVGIFNRKKKEG